jgi:hypothetical protein
MTVEASDADDYRRLAANCEQRAKAESKPEISSEWLILARACRQLAEHEDAKAGFDSTEI